MTDRGSARRLWVPLLCLILFVVAVTSVGCESDSGSGTSAADLKNSLVPAERVNLEQDREFEWEDPIDFVAQGLFYSEGTTPSELIGEIDNAGFERAAGENLKDKAGELFLFVGAVAFDSEDGANEARDIIHEDDLKQPCFGACVVSSEDYEVEGIPNSVAVHQVPNEGPSPPGLFKFEAYLLEFTVGSDLYVLQADGPPGGISSADFDRWAKAFYDHAVAQD